MLFEFCKNCPPYGEEYYLLDDVSIHDGFVEATIISDKRCTNLGTPFYIKDNTKKKFFAGGSFTLIEYTGKVSEIQ